MFQSPGPDFSIGTALRLSFVAWFRNLIPFTVLTAILYLPLLGWVIVATRGAPEAAELSRLSLLLPLGVFLINSLLTGTVTYGVVMDLRGERASLASSLGVGVRRALPILGVSVLMWLAIGVGMLALFVPGLIVMYMLFVAIPASVVERPGLVGALRRSRELTKGNRWGLVGLSMLSGIPIAVTTFGLQRAMLGDPATASASQWTPYLFAELGRMVLVAPYAAVLPAIAYFLLRQEKEGTSARQLGSIFE